MSDTKNLLLPFLLAVFLAPLAPDRARAEEKTEKLVNIDVKDKPLYAIADYLRSFAGENIFLGRAASGESLERNPKVQVTIRFEDVPFSKALRRLCDAVGARLTRVHGKVWHVEQPPRVTLKTGYRPLATLVSMVARSSHRPVFWRPEALAGIFSALDLKDAAWHDALDSLAGQAGCELLQTTEGRGRVYLLAPAGFWERSLGVWEPWAPHALDDKPPGDGRTVDLDVVDTPLRKVVTYLGEVSGQSIHMGRAASGEPLEKDDDPRTTCKLAGVHWLTALLLSAESAGADVWRTSKGAWIVEKPPGMTLRTEGVALAKLLPAVTGFTKSAPGPLPEGSHGQIAVACTVPLSVRTASALRGLAGAAGLVVPHREKAAGLPEILLPGKTMSLTGAGDALKQERAYMEKKLASWTRKLTSLKLAFKGGPVHPRSGLRRLSWVARDLKAGRFYGSFEHRRNRLLREADVLHRPFLQSCLMKLLRAICALANALGEDLKVHDYEEALRRFEDELPGLMNAGDMLATKMLQDDLALCFSLVGQALDGLLERKWPPGRVREACERMERLLSGPAKKHAKRLLEELDRVSKRAAVCEELASLKLAVRSVALSGRRGGPKKALINGVLVSEGEIVPLSRFGVKEGGDRSLLVRSISPSGSVTVLYRGVVKVLRLKAGDD